MIRMGRSSKQEPSNKTNYQSTAFEPKAAASQFSSETQQASSRAVTDSESMARDIKEGRLSGFVGHGTTLTGETSFQAMLRIDGHLIGTVSSDSGTLIVGTNGQVDANIIVSAAMINGVVNGDIVATEKIQLGRTARVVGNIKSPRLLIEDGAVFEGSCSMMKAREVIETRQSEAEAQQQAAELARYEAENTIDAEILTEDDEIAEAVAS